MKTKLVLFLVACIAATQVHANFSQQFLESDSDPFDTIALFSNSGDIFATPTNDILYRSDWTEMYSSPTWAFAQGPATNQLYFVVNFLGNGIDPFSFDFVAWNNGVIADSATIYWNQGWTFGPVSQERSVPSVPSAPSVPDASSTVALLGLGMIGLFVAARRRASK